MFQPFLATVNKFGIVSKCDYVTILGVDRSPLPKGTGYTIKPNFWTAFITMQKPLHVEPKNVTYLTYEGQNTNMHGTVRPTAQKVGPP